jgi:hypothetical protein
MAERGLSDRRRLLMCCSTCDDYQLVPGENDLLVDCPDCHAVKVTEFCIFHAETRLNVEGECPWCSREVKAAMARLVANSLRRRAAETAQEMAA